MFFFMARKFSLKKYIANLNMRIKNREIVKSDALRILRGKAVAIKRRKKRAIEEEKLISKVKNRLNRSK